MPPLMSSTSLPGRLTSNERITIICGTGQSQAGGRRVSGERCGLACCSVSTAQGPPPAAKAIAAAAAAVAVHRLPFIPCPQPAHLRRRGEVADGHRDLLHQVLADLRGQHRPGGRG